MYYVLFAIFLFFSSSLGQGTWSVVTEGGVNFIASPLFAGSAVYSENLNQVVYFGGLNSASQATNQRFRFDIASSTWLDTGVATGPTGRYSHTAIAWNGMMIIFGGFNGASPISSASDILWEYGLEGAAGIIDIWNTVTLTVIPTPRYLHTAAVINGIMYVYGGAASSTQFLNDLWAYTITTQTFTQITTATGTSPGILKRHGSVPTNTGKIIFGGESGDTSTIVNTLFIYDPVLNAWTQGISGGPTVRFPIMGTINSIIMVFGGSDSNGEYGGLYSYTLGTSSWSTYTTGIPNDEGSAIVTGLNQFYVFRGKNDSIHFNGLSVWAPPNTVGFTPITTAQQTTQQQTTAIQTTAQQTTAIQTTVIQTTATDSTTGTQGGGGGTTQQEHVSSSMKLKPVLFMIFLLFGYSSL